jgi:hypothetical protein
MKTRIKGSEIEPTELIKKIKGFRHYARVYFFALGTV